MGKIKLKRALWNAKTGETINVSAEREAWAVNRGYAEPVMEEIKSKTEPVVRQKKVEPGIRGRKKKNAN